MIIFSFHFQRDFQNRKWFGSEVGKPWTEPLKKMNVQGLSTSGLDRTESRNLGCKKYGWDALVDKNDFWDSFPFLRK